MFLLILTCLSFPSVYQLYQTFIIHSFILIKWLYLQLLMKTEVTWLIVSQLLTSLIINFPLLSLILLLFFWAWYKLKILLKMLWWGKSPFSFLELCFPLRSLSPLPSAFLITSQTTSQNSSLSLSSPYSVSLWGFIPVLF